MLVSFFVLYIIIYLTNRGIRKGLKEFFEKENKVIPKLPNKSLAFVISAITSAFTSETLKQKIILCASNSEFGKTDPIFNLDIGYYIFQKPLIETMLN